MGYQTIEVRKLTPAIGAEIFGVDLARPLGNQQFQEMHDALMENLVIFFRDQELTTSSTRISAAASASCTCIRPRRARTGEHPEILVIKADENSKHVAGEEWHSDVSCDPEPPMGSILYMKELPPDNGGNTLFANMYRAYETLSAPIQKLCEGLTAVHDGAQVYGGRFGQTPKAGRLSAQRASGGAHPSGDRPQGALRQPQLHHAHRRPARSTRATRCSRCSTATARRRNSSAASPGGPTRSPSGTTAAAMHHAMWDYFPHKRLGYRVTVKGDKPFYRA